MSLQARLRTPPSSVRLVTSHALAACAMSMPWPALLALVWESTHSEVWLAVVGGARMAPYVFLSWAAGVLGDRVPRGALIRVSTWLRAVLLFAALLALAAGHLASAVVLATVVVAVGTPAYPALAAALPATAKIHPEQATRWLVTFEVSAFVVGPAVGGLVMGAVSATASLAVAAGVALAASILLTGARVSGQTAATGRASRSIAVLTRTPAAVRVIVAVAAVNFVVGCVAVGLLPLVEEQWSAGSRAFGLATAAFGFGALATPLFCHVLRLGATATTAALMLTALPLLAVAASPSWTWALLPLAIAGAGATQVECAATAVIQRAVPDHARAFALGVTDSAMVTASLFGAVLAPFLAEVLTPVGMVVVLGVTTAAMVLVVNRPSDALPARPRRAGAGSLQRAQGLRRTATSSALPAPRQ